MRIPDRMLLLTAAATLLLGAAHAPPAAAQDWRDIDVPRDPLPGHDWVLDWSVSDSFNYSDKSDWRFTRRWREGKPDGWLGPGATFFKAGNSFLVGGKLTIFGSRVPEARRGAPRNDHGFFTDRNTHTAYITSKKQLRPPLYTEVRMKASSTPLSSNFWLLSDDNETEIDVVEIYGDTDWFRRHPAHNAHFFKRGGNGDINRQGHHTTDRRWDNQYHRYGVFWQNDRYCEIFYDGDLVRQMWLPGQIPDPTGQYLNRSMRLIFDLEAHTWRKQAGVPSDADLADWGRNNMQVDWVRTYRSVGRRGR
ncbi:family 16 glycosylhydrolase [Phycisphaera mikurensis]|nr:family 16 glycosylhydrolase [Phycisphaera mikurensis]MBB6441864.1 hypothetical protein [Phycisphaera mikurensis]